MGLKKRKFAITASIPTAISLKVGKKERLGKGVGTGNLRFPRDLLKWNFTRCSRGQNLV